jgi:hypothetical protein
MLVRLTIRIALSPPLAREALPTEGPVLFTTLLDTDQAKTWSNINVYWQFDMFRALASALDGSEFVIADH